MNPREDLPLRFFTPESWAPLALSDPIALLNDHAHLEKKAASNALDMLLRWPEPSPPDGWVQAMTSIAIDEVSHLNSVTRILSRRGGALSRSHRSRYAADLRVLVRTGRGPHELLDRLLVSALIEARSCERFFLLADVAADEELAKLYRGLYQSEAGHYRVFLQLAKDLPDADTLGVDDRWRLMLTQEAEIAASQPKQPGLHTMGWGG